MVHKDKSDAACLIYVTFDREYLFEGSICVRSRSRKTGVWERVAPTRLLGVLRRGEQDPALVARFERPRVGDRLCMTEGGAQVLSSPVVAVERAVWASFELRQDQDGSFCLGALVLDPHREEDDGERQLDIVANAATGDAEADSLGVENFGGNVASESEVPALSEEGVQKVERPERTSRRLRGRWSHASKTQISPGAV